MRRLVARYEGFHQHMLVADGRALDFYRKCGFERAGKTEPMWIYVRAALQKFLAHSDVVAASKSLKNPEARLAAFQDTEVEAEKP